MADVSMTGREKDGVAGVTKQLDDPSAQDLPHIQGIRKALDALRAAFVLRDPPTLLSEITAPSAFKKDDLLARAVAPYIQQDNLYPTPALEYQAMYDVGYALAEIRKSPVWSRFFEDTSSLDPASWIPGLADRVLKEPELDEDCGRIVLTLAENLDSPWARNTLARLSLECPEPYVCIPAFIALAGRDEQAAKELLPKMWSSLTDDMQDWLLTELYPGREVDRQAFANSLPDSIETFGIYRPVLPERSDPDEVTLLSDLSNFERRALYVHLGLSAHTLENEESDANPLHPPG